MRIQYRSPQSEEPKVHLLDPWGLVLGDGTLYFVGKSEKWQTPTLFAIHRIQQVTLLESPATAMPEDFDLERFAKESLSFAQARTTLRLRLQVARELSFVLDERPLSEDQRIEYKGRKWITFSATVPDSLQLRWWILSFGPAMRVVDPPGLFQEMRQLAMETARQYGRRPQRRCSLAGAADGRFSEPPAGDLFQGQ